MEKIKIAHVAHSVGGVDVYLRLILENIDNKSFSNIVVHGHTDTNVPFYDKDNTQIKSYQTSIIRDISLVNDFKAIYSVYRIFKKERPDLIHVHSAKGGIVGRVAAKLLGTKVIFTPHAFSYLSAENNKKRWVYLMVERFFSHGKVVVLATSDSEKNRAINEVKFTREKAFTIDNSINEINGLPPLKISKTWPDEYICTVGRPSYQKNIEFMIEVLYEINQIRKTHLVIMGVGHHSDRLHQVKALIEKRNLAEQVTLIDWTERDNILNIIKDSELYISTARYEGLPYSVVESLALSKPCVVSDCDGNRDLIQDGYNGFVIKEGEKKTFVEKTIYLLSDTKAHAQFSKNAYASFKEKYDVSNNIKALEKFYIKHSEKQVDT